MEDEEGEDPPDGGVAVRAELGAVPTAAVAVVRTVAVVMQVGQEEGALLPERGLRGVLVLIGCVSVDRVCWHGVSGDAGGAGGRSVVA